MHTHGHTRWKARSLPQFFKLFSTVPGGRSGKYHPSGYSEGLSLFGIHRGCPIRAVSPPLLNVGQFARTARKCVEYPNL